MPRWPIWASLADAAAWLMRAYAIALVGAIAIVLLYIVSLRDPWLPCRRCGGSNTRQRSHGLGGAAFSSGCGGRRCIRGRRLRWGVRVLQPARARTLSGE